MDKSSCSLVFRVLFLLANFVAMSEFASEENKLKTACGKMFLLKQLSLLTALCV